MKIHAPHVTGIIIATQGADGKERHTTFKAEIVSDQLQLRIKQGAAEIRLLSSDWEFVVARVEETLAKKRLITAK